MFDTKRNKRDEFGTSQRDPAQEIGTTITSARATTNKARTRFQGAPVHTTHTAHVSIITSSFGMEAKPSPPAEFFHHATSVYFLLPRVAGRREKKKKRSYTIDRARGRPSPIRSDPIRAETSPAPSPPSPLLSPPPRPSLPSGFSRRSPRRPTYCPTGRWRPGSRGCRQR